MNDAQRRAICHGDGPARVLAGPGSGKTFVIVQRLRYLITKLHVDPSSILVITFTKAAAEEMQERFYKVMDDEVCPVHFGTFHAVFYYILQRSNSNFSKHIISDSDKITVIKQIRTKFNKKFSEISLPMEDEIIKQIGKFKNLGEDFSKLNKEQCTIEESHFMWLYSEYNRVLLMEELLDFDDMAMQCFMLFKDNQKCLEYWQQRFKYILIDEFQDINKPQYDVVNMLAGNNRNLFVVGDDDQSIYGFRGSNPCIMHDFIKDYSKSQCILLNVNYRSRNGIIKAAEKCISENKARITKEIKCREEVLLYENDNSVAIKAFDKKDEERKYLIQRLTEWRESGNLYEDVAIICRTNVELEEYAIALEKEKIPFQRKEKRKSIFEHPIMKDLEAYLRVADGEKNRQLLLQIINHPKRYIGRFFFTKENMGLLDLKEACREEPEKYAIVSKLEEDCIRISKMRPYLAVNYIRKGIGYDEYLKELAGSSKEKFQQLLEIIDFFQNHSMDYYSSKEWLEAINRHKKEYVQSDDKSSKRGVNLITMHGSKGLEFPMVIIPDVNEGVIPRRNISKDDLEEERRIFYVAMTRAKNNLELYYINGKDERKRLPSRFIKPLLEKQSD